MGGMASALPRPTTVTSKESGHRIQWPVDEGRIETAVSVLQLLGDPTRLRILCALLNGELSVGRLADTVDAQPPAVSQHLAKLRLAHLVRHRRSGNRIYYVADNHVRELVHEALAHAAHVRQGLPDHDTGAEVSAG